MLDAEGKGVLGKGPFRSHGCAVDRKGITKLNLTDTVPSTRWYPSIQWKAAFPNPVFDPDGSDKESGR